MVELDKPIYMGMSILDYSKIHMYSFHYDVLKPKYDDKTKLVYTDTDSYVIKLRLMTYMKTLRRLMNTWILVIIQQHPSYDKTNKKVLGNSRMK